MRDWLSREARAEGPAITSDEHLDTALARMLGTGRDTLPVVDKAGKPAGAIGLGDLLRRRP